MFCFPAGQKQRTRRAGGDKSGCRFRQTSGCESSWEEARSTFHRLRCSSRAGADVHWRYCATYGARLPVSDSFQFVSCLLVSARLAFHLGSASPLRADIHFPNSLRVSSPSAGGGSVNELTLPPVTWAATLGRGTPSSRDLSTGSSAVSLSFNGQ